MSPLADALLLALLGGLSIPLGGLAARAEHIQNRWLEQEFRHSVLAFGGGALLAAVTLILVPKGAESLPTVAAIVLFLAGGATFLFIDRLIARYGGTQLLAMCLDFLPESAALGALLAVDRGAGLVLAMLIALQNLPEAFNAYREIAGRRRVPRKVIIPAFFGIAMLGPLAAYLGHSLLSDAPATLGGVMIFAAGGILYIVFQDIAPSAKLRNAWAPPFGAVLGFALGMAGQAIVG
jgi:ZIP family zinc transporter